MHLGLKQVQVAGVYIVSEYQMNVSVSPSVLEKKKKKMFGKVLIVDAFNERKQAGWSTC